MKVYRYIQKKSQLGSIESGSCGLRNVTQTLMVWSPLIQVVSYIQSVYVCSNDFRIEFDLRLRPYINYKILHQSFSPLTQESSDDSMKNLNKDKH